MGFSLHLVVVLPFLLAPAVPFLARRLGPRLGWALVPAPFLITLYLLSVLPVLAEGQVLTASWTWAP